MKITIAAVGKIKEKYLKQGIQEYTKRLGAYANIEIMEVNDEKAPENMSKAEQEAVKRKEGERILSKIPHDAYVISLEIKGEMVTSEKFAEKIEQLMIHGKSKIFFVIGGSLGLSKEVMERSNYALSFSKMTLPHQLMRLVLVEQIYRGFRIMKGEPYHK